MSVSLCTCIRDDRFRRMLPDPDCTAKSHKWDEDQELYQ